MSKPIAASATPIEAPIAPSPVPAGALVIQVVINPPAVPGAQPEPTINTTGTPHDTVMALNLAMALMLQHVTDRPHTERIYANEEPQSRIVKVSPHARVR